MDMSLIYSTDPTQLLGELAGAQWPPKERASGFNSFIQS
jgi:hypothetical protein